MVVVEDPVEAVDLEEAAEDAVVSVEIEGLIKVPQNMLSKSLLFLMLVKEC